MNAKLKSLLQLMMSSPRRFPVEAALGVAFFIIAVWDTETSAWNEEAGRMTSQVNGDILWLFVPLLALTFWLGRLNRKAYMASFFLFLPLMALDLQPFLWTYGFSFTYVLAAILLVVGNKRMDNRTFAAHTLHVVTQLFLGVLIAGVLTLAVMAVTASFFYIFSIDAPNHFYAHVLQFIWIVTAPQFCCTLVRQHEDEVAEPAKALRMILNLILSPAVIIYTVILYTYFIKIALEWNLPKGGVAWMVMGFVTAALIGTLAQSILRQRNYDWFYRRFTLIAIPPLIVYWIGSLYRIRLYSFTESRFYLMVAGVLMTLFVLMLAKERTRRFQLMALIAAAAIVMFTYIPGISASSIGLYCQKQRLAGLISEMALNNPQTGKLNNDIDMKAIKQDSLLCERYREATSVIKYVRKEMGSDEFADSYGKWTHSELSFNYIGNNRNDDGFWYSHLKKPLDLGDYNILLPEEDYTFSFDNGKVSLKVQGGQTVMEYPINDIVRADTMLLHRPEQLLTYRNDSLLLIVSEVCIGDSTITHASGYTLYRKRGRQAEEP